MAGDLKKWPPLEGRYKVGNVKSAVAVCTNATVAGIDLDMEKVSIIGKCVTENIGIEKIIQNIVSNPHIRFLILCGKVSKGHFVSQAFISLKKNGVDEKKRIIGAKGNIPFLRSVNKDIIERFRKQVAPIDLMPEENPSRIMEKVNSYLKQNPGPFDGKPIEIKEVEEIEARSCPDFVIDPKGFFVISIERKRKKIIAEHYQDSKLMRKIIGDSAEGISKTIANLDLIGDFKQTREHSMYLARELQKAEIALKNDLDYEQGSELILKKESVKKDNEYDWFD
ncbi:MAG TPA: tetrahydromethanopterin S-methyltransferase subunit A [Candidatus Parcubacteria bacterium]|jgi:tetrahydromethanopterin S-methyltransferase subunit A|nr:tetrahydromethanopterin S-methyltransferase subunit A [Candidatus Parcubacteria bacterium]|tara:strand:+ start:118 stop:960 length:843 start_codon:yes stop_codon:yes gene_type:complete